MKKHTITALVLFLILQTPLSRIIVQVTNLAAGIQKITSKNS
jgi:alpha-D-xyloside xylohydrolase